MPTTRTRRIPRTLSDLGRVISEIGDLLIRRKDKLQEIHEQRLRLKQRLKKLDEDEARITRGFDRRLNLRANVVFTFGQENYDELTENGEIRTVRLPNGEQFRWRNSGLKVLWIDPKAFIKEIRRKRLYNLFAREKIIIEPNLEALTAHPDQARRLKSVRLGTEDTFAILPNGTDLRYQTVVEDEDREWSIEAPKERTPKKE